MLLFGCVEGAGITTVRMIAVEIAWLAVGITNYHLQESQLERAFTQY
jgi:hypothetical protein